MEITMNKEIKANYEALLQGFTPFQIKQQIRNLTYNAHRAMYQTKEHDRFSGIKEQYDLQWDRMSIAQEQKLDEKDSEAWNRTVNFTEALDQDFKHMKKINLIRQDATSPNIKEWENEGSPETSTAYAKKHNLMEVSQVSQRP